MKNSKITLKPQYSKYIYQLHRCLLSGTVDCTKLVVLDFSVAGSTGGLFTLDPHKLVCNVLCYGVTMAVTSLGHRKLSAV